MILEPLYIAIRAATALIQESVFRTHVWEPFACLPTMAVIIKLHQRRSWGRMTKRYPSIISCFRENRNEHKPLRAVKAYSSLSFTAEILFASYPVCLCVSSTVEAGQFRLPIFFECDRISIYSSNGKNSFQDSSTL